MPINLLYHDITAAGSDDLSGFPGPEAARYKLSPDEFAHHLQRIADVSHQPPLTWTTLEQGPIDDHPSWIITFDDGGSSAITEIATQLEQHGWRGWFFIATDFIGKPSFCTRDQVKELHQRGHVIGSHSCSHPEYFSHCPWTQLVDEWSRSCEVLSNIIEQPVTSGSVPGGFYSKEVALSAAKVGIRVLFNSEPTTSVSRIDNMLVLGRYNVYRGMSATNAAMLLTSPFRRWRQLAFWNVKKAAKIAVGPLYKLARQRILARNYANPISNRENQ